MATATANGIELAYETMGDPADPALLLIMGLGSQMVSWDDEFCQGLLDRGFFVIRFDNRDVGLSTKVDTDVDVMVAVMTVLSGGEYEAPYDLWDMAEDAITVLDALGVDQAHVVGASMGGMIAQALAIKHPERVRSLTSIMSTTGDPDVGQPNPEVIPVLLQAPPVERVAAIAQKVEVWRTISGPEFFDEDRARIRSTVEVDRCLYPAGVGHQLLAIMVSGSRSDALRHLDRPTLVIHGDVDPLVNVTGGERTADVVPGAELLILEGMGHDLPMIYWPQITEAITALAIRS